MNPYDPPTIPMGYPAPPPNNRKQGMFQSTAPLVAWLASILSVALLVFLAFVFTAANRYKTERDDARDEVAELSDVRADLTASQSKLRAAREDVDIATDVGSDLILVIEDCQVALHGVAQAADALDVFDPESANDLYNSVRPEIESCNTSGGYDPGGP